MLTKENSEYHLAWKLKNSDLQHPKWQIGIHKFPDYDRASFINKEAKQQHSSSKVESIVVFKLPSGEIHSIFINGAREMLLACQKNGFFSTSNLLKKFKTNEEFRQFLTFLNTYEPLEDFLEVILRLTDIRLSEEETADNISNYTNAGKYTEAVKKAEEEQRGGYYELIWALAQSLEDANINPMQLIHVYEIISPLNPHYKEANHRLVTLYTKQLFPNHNPYYYMEKQLAAAVNAQEPQLIDQIFHQLCGINDLSPQIHDVNLNTITLINLANRIRTLSAEVCALQQKNERLENNVEMLNNCLDVKEKFTPRVQSGNSKEAQPRQNKSDSSILNSQSSFLKGLSNINTLKRNPTEELESSDEQKASIN